jgi:hypothetical protein
MNILTTNKPMIQDLQQYYYDLTNLINLDRNHLEAMGLLMFYKHASVFFSL